MSATENYPVQSCADNDGAISLRGEAQQTVGSLCGSFKDKAFDSRSFVLGPRQDRYALLTIIGGDETVFHCSHGFLMASWALISQNE